MLILFDDYSSIFFHFLPSPVLDFPPNLFIAIASVVWASIEILPNDIAPVANLLTILAADSTSSI